MNEKQEGLIATGLWLLIKSSDKISSAEKKVWMMDYDDLFGESEEPTLPERTHDALSEDALNVDGEVKE